MKRVHVIGAGLAGLCAALHLARAGAIVTVHEAAPHAGGRCRSFVDPVLNATIDNGAHLMLSGNVELRSYLEMTGATAEMITAPRARFDFFDAKSDHRWSLDFGASKGWFSLLRTLMHAKNRPPGVSAWTLLRDMHALKGGAKKNAMCKTVASCVGLSPAFKVFWEPLTVAVLNAHPDEAAAALLWRVLVDTVLRGGDFARPLFTRQGLGAALVNPALATLDTLGAQVRFGRRVQALETTNDRIVSLDLGGEVEVLGSGDAVVMAVPHFAACDLFEGLRVPTDSRAILNVHFQLPSSIDTSHQCPMTGLINSDAQWVFVRGNIASVTVSAADSWMDTDGNHIAKVLWPDVAKVLDIKGMMPPHRVIKERRATFAQTPEALATRPQTRTMFDNLFLAGDWTATDLPATIEGALLSGRIAAQAALSA